jgi:hypothetical protein
MELGDLCRAIDGQISKCAHFPNEQVAAAPANLLHPRMRLLRLASLIVGIVPIAHLQAFLYLYQVCEALAYTHSMGIIHRWSASAAPHAISCHVH